MYSKDKHFHDAIEKIKKYVELYSKEDNLEIEFRLGYNEEDEFKTDIGKELYDKIYNTMILSDDSWSKINQEFSEDYFYSGKRMSVTKDETICIKKEKIATFDYAFKGSGFDLRISFSREIPTKKFDLEKYNYKRIKDRTSFLHKHLSYDLTKVTMDDNNIEDHLFEVELEIKKIDLTKMTSHYIIHDALLKITDLVKICEDIDYDYSLKLTKENVY